MKGVNRVFLLGNIGKEPTVRATSAQTIIANFALATSERHKDQQGNWQDATEWHNLVAFGRIAELVRDYVKKGSQLFIEGKLQTRSWDDNGQKRYRTEIVVSELTLLGGSNHGDKQSVTAPKSAAYAGEF